MAGARWPPAKAPDTIGFGLKLMEQLVTHDLRGAFDLTFPARGVECTVRAPVTEVLAQIPDAGL